ncbi:hypothetical protein V6N11_065559 [Hibiscus sabdariffa]|uniref:Uncharacterized protein n=1 Tax=Hibiscus sabdariffa TaxID=183260 RepID=A0ABR2PHS8_9ROSI
MGFTHDIFPKVQPHIYSWINRYGDFGTELVKEALRNSGKAFSKAKPSFFVNKLFGKGLVFILEHCLGKNMAPAVIASFETMLEKWKGQEGKEIKVFGEFRLLTLEVISRTAFGSSYLKEEKI